MCARVRVCCWRRSPIKSGCVALLGSRRRNLDADSGLSRPSDDKVETAAWPPPMSLIFTRGGQSQKYWVVAVTRLLQSRTRMIADWAGEVGEVGWWMNYRAADRMDAWLVWAAGE